MINNRKPNKLFNKLNEIYNKPVEKSILNNDVERNKEYFQKELEEIEKKYYYLRLYFGNNQYFDVINTNNTNKTNNTNNTNKTEKVNDPNLYDDDNKSFLKIVYKNKQNDISSNDIKINNGEDCCNDGSNKKNKKQKRDIVKEIDRCIQSLEDFLVGINNKEKGKNTTGKVITKKKQNEKLLEVDPVNKVYKNTVTINTEINSISDLLRIIEENVYDQDTKYNIDLKALHNIKEPLIELNNMIGMNNLKNNVLDQILYFIQNLHLNNKTGKPNDFLHTVIYGQPGTGKTEVAKIMGQIFSKLGILKKETFKKVTRSDLVAGYLGQTAIKTSEVIQEALDGVLFIDEAYALGNPEKRDSFSKECIDTLCEALSDNKERLMVIIAGYETELKECFFSYNQGLESRFNWRYKVDDYKGEELYRIFLKKIFDFGWKINFDDVDTLQKLNIEWFDKNLVYFKYFGRDIETLVSKIKIAHSRRVFCLSEEEKRKITYKDFIKGFEIFCSLEDVKKRKENAEMKNRLSSLYI